MMKYKKPSRNFITYAMVVIVFLLCELALSGMIDGFKMSRSLKGQLVPICVYIVMAVSLNLTVGISGELSLGHAGFMSVGAFSGILVSQYLLFAFPEANLEVVRLIAALAAGGLFAGIAGVLIGIPVLRLNVFRRQSSIRLNFRLLHKLRFRLFRLRGSCREILVTDLLCCQNLLA